MICFLQKKVNQLLESNFFSEIYDLYFKIFSEKKLETFEEKINDNSFTFETLKDDGFMLSKIPNYLKSN